MGVIDGLVPQLNPWARNPLLKSDAAAREFRAWPQELEARM
jgi:hypothetical protein